MIGDWVEDVCATTPEGEPVAQAVARQHAAFERIHLFLDGNGRAGRLLMNLTLVRLGYPPAMIDKRQRLRYLDALGSADRGDAGPLGEMVARAVLHNLTRFLLPSVAGDEELIPLEALADRISASSRCGLPRGVDASERCRPQGSAGGAHGSG